MVAAAYFRPFTAFAAALLLSLTALTGCDKDVVLKTLNVRLDTNLTMHVNAGDPLAATYTQVLDPDSTADVRDNRAKIKKIVIDRLSYRISDFEGAAGITGGGTWKVYPADAPTQVTTLSTVSGLDFTALEAAGTETDLPISEAAKTALSGMINDRKKLVFVFEGTVSDSPAHTRFRLHLFTKIDVGV